MLQLYRSISGTGGPLFETLLTARARKGKELPERLGERRGEASLPRPAAPLIWIHAASVGEAQSALILVDRLMKQAGGAQILMTTGTVSSAAAMQKNLPPGALHQFYPLDHPRWVAGFLDHWRPDLALWMESELWPNMLLELKRRAIPAVMVNARLSDKSFRRWKCLRGAARQILGAFSLILTQGDAGAARYRALDALQVIVTGNIKYSARPLPFHESDLGVLSATVGGRPVWVFASTHKGEEAMACRVHQTLKAVFPDLLTVIVPRHPDRRGEIADICRAHNLEFILRGDDKKLPAHETDIYIADTFGELGLFYRLAPVACIGRSFSDDGGGGHNPIEAAQLNCAVLYGPNVQFQKELYEDMSAAGAALPLQSETELANTLRDMFSDPGKIESLRRAGAEFTRARGDVVDRVIEALAPFMEFRQGKAAP